MVQETELEELRIATWSVILERQVRDNPIGVMEKLPIDVVWEAALDHLERNTYAVPQEQVELLIRRLKMGGGSEWWTRLLSWYVTKTGERIGLEASEFAIGLLREDSSQMQQVSKIICGGLRNSHHDSLYWAIPSRQWLFEEVLEFFQRETKYFDSDWQMVQRVIRQIVVNEDISFAPQIERLSEQVGTHLVPYGFERDPFVLKQNQAFLSTAVEQLENIRAQQLPDLNVLFGSHLREKAGLSGSVSVVLDYLGQQTAEEGDQVAVTLVFQATKPEETDRLLRFLGDYRVHCSGEGFWTDSWRGFISSGEANFVDNPLQGTVLLPVKTKGAKRFALELWRKKDFSGGYDSIGEVHGYINII